MPLNALVESQCVKICRPVIAVQYSGGEIFHELCHVDKPSVVTSASVVLNYSR